MRLHLLYGVWQVDSWCPVAGQAEPELGSIDESEVSLVNRDLMRW